MAGPDRPNPKSLVDDMKNVFDTDSDDGGEGIGPTLGQDVGPRGSRRPAEPSPPPARPARGER